MEMNPEDIAKILYPKNNPSPDLNQGINSESEEELELSEKDKQFMDRLNSLFK